MPAQDTSKTKEEIVRFLQNNGPSLPIQISKHIKMDSLFASAFLSELLTEQKIKITNLKVGTSPIYYIPGTESKLEKFSEHLKSKEKEAFNILKENKFLEDETQHPAIRVALRNIKDFAKPFKTGDKIIWRYFIMPISEYNTQTTEPQVQKEANLQSTINSPQDNPTVPSGEAEGEQRGGGRAEIKKETLGTKLPASFISSVQQTIENNEKKEEKIKNTNDSINPTNDNEDSAESMDTPKEKKSETKSKPIAPIFKKEIPKSNLQNPTSNFTNPLAAKIEIKPQEEKPKPEFCIRIIEIIQNNNWEIIEEIECKKKEYNALIQVKSDLGPIIFKLQAKDKKTVGEADMSKHLGESQTIPLPALYMTHGEPKKKAKEFLDQYISVIKYKQIE